MTKSADMPVLPPGNRTDLGRAQTAAAVSGKLVLQHCEHCTEVQYPPREICRNCLSDNLHWRATSNSGTVLSAVELHRSLEPYFQARTPWMLGSVKLDCGQVVLLQLPTDCSSAGSRVVVTQVIDESGEAVMIASQGQEKE